MTDTLRAALYSISPEDRDTWVEIGMAIKSELGDGGFDLWDGWSRQSDRYKAADARAVWRSIKQRNGGITIGTLYHMAKEHGWAGEGASQAAARCGGEAAAGRAGGTRGGRDGAQA